MRPLAFFSDCIEPHFQRVICYYPFLGLRHRVLVKRDFAAENPYNILTRMPGCGSEYLRYTARVLRVSGSPIEAHPLPNYVAVNVCFDCQRE
jgi:hypothetical protein